MVFPCPRQVIYTYDANGNMTSIQPPGRSAHVFNYNEVNLESDYDPPLLGGSETPTVYDYNLDKQLVLVTRPDQKTIEYVYDDASGWLESIVTDRGTTTFEYSMGFGSGTPGTLASVTTPEGEVMGYTYDGFLSKDVMWSGTVDGVVSRAYDNDFRTTHVLVNGGNAIGYTYDTDGLLTGAGELTIARNAQNGLITGTTLGGVTTTRGYNGFAEIQSYGAAFDSTGLYSAGYIRDKLGRITEKTETVDGTTRTYKYGYDPAGRLEDVLVDDMAVSHYDYDDNGNRLKKTDYTSGEAVEYAGIYDEQDRMTTYGQYAYTYSANGELESRRLVLNPPRLPVPITRKPPGRSGAKRTRN